MDKKKETEKRRLTLSAAELAEAGIAFLCGICPLSPGVNPFGLAYLFSKAKLTLPLAAGLVLSLPFSPQPLIYALLYLLGFAQLWLSARAQAARCRACGALRGVRSGAGADCVALLGRGRICRGAVRVRGGAGVRVPVSGRFVGQAVRTAALRTAGVRLCRGAGDDGFLIFLFPAAAYAGFLRYAGGGSEKPLFVGRAVRVRLCVGGGHPLYARADRTGTAVRVVFQEECPARAFFRRLPLAVVSNAYLLDFRDLAPLLVNACCALAAFLPVHKRIPALFPEQTAEGEASRPDKRPFSLSAFSACFSSLSQVFYTVNAETKQTNATETCRRVQQAALSVCSACRGCTCDKRDLCNNLMKHCLSEGFITEEDLPDHIRFGCKWQAAAHRDGQRRACQRAGRKRACGGDAGGGVQRIFPPAQRGVPKGGKRAFP